MKDFEYGDLDSADLDDVSDAVNDIPVNDNMDIEPDLTLTSEEISDLIDSKDDPGYLESLRTALLEGRLGIETDEGTDDCPSEKEKGLFKKLSR